MTKKYRGLYSIQVPFTWGRMIRKGSEIGGGMGTHLSCVMLSHALLASAPVEKSAKPWATPSFQFI